jgi:hypothetical protein
MRSLLFLWPVLLLSCAHDPPTPTVGAPMPCPFAAANDGTQSYDLLCREPVANHVKVKHVLIGWKELAGPGHPVDPRAAERTYADAQVLARQLLEKLRSGEAIEPLMLTYSEDPGSARSGREYEVSPDAGMVSEFKSLSMRLQVSEAGIVRSTFGLHVIQRVQ